MAFSLGGGSTPAFGTAQASNPFGQQQQQPQQSSLSFGTKPFGAPTTTGGGGLTMGFGQQAAGTGFGTTQPSLFGGGAQQQQAQQPNLFGGGTTLGAAPQPYQQQYQQQLQQRRYWENELDLLRDSYTPQTQLLTPGVMQQQRLTDYKFVFRVTDSATGMLRDAYLGDHRQVDAKLQSQKAEMDKVNHHILTLRKNVEALVSQAAMARNRLDACREKSMSITHRFLVVLQRLQVMHNINRPFDARDKEMKDRLELMAAKLEDVVRSLNDVAAVVEEEEAEMRGESRGEFSCDLSPADLDLLQRALEKQQVGLDEVTKVLRRDVKGVELLRDKLDSRQMTL